MTLHNDVPAVLMLEDGTVFEGSSCGSAGEAFGEIVFNTSMSGYQEILSDPSYAGQIITMTYPHIGNYGVNGDDAQSRGVFCRGLVVRDMCDRPSNFRSGMSLPDYLASHGIVAIEGIDTRKLVRHVRERGAMKAVVSTACDDMASLAKRLNASASIVGVNLAAEVSCGQPYELSAHDGAARHHVVALDCGIKTGILDGLRGHGCDVTVMPWNTSLDDVLARAPDGVFLSNGPGDPQAVVDAYELARQLVGQFPVFGICLGHQMLSIAAGAQIEKLRYGHHGGNQPVMNLRTGAVEITAQNHGFGQVFESIGPLVPELSGGLAEHPESLLFWSERHIALSSNRGTSAASSSPTSTSTTEHPRAWRFSTIPSSRCNTIPKQLPAPMTRRISSRRSPASWTVAMTTSTSRCETCEVPPRVRRKRLAKA